MISFNIVVSIIVSGIPFGILSAIAVKNKNRDQAGWFLIGLLCNAFGLIAALIVDRVEPQQRPKSDTRFDLSLETKKCPDCAEVIKLEAKVCRYCHHQFSEEEVALQIATAEQMHASLRRNRVQGPTDIQRKFTEDLRARFSKRSTEKLQKMRRQGRASWSEEALLAVDSILNQRGIEQDTQKSS